MGKPLRFGIIGAGMIANFHAKAIQETPGAALISVMSTGEKRREEFAAKNGIRAYADMASFLADPELDAVALATPTGLHRDGALAAARAGKHVLCEKPLETTPERAQDIIDACREHGVFLAPVFQYRYNPAALLVKEAVECGRFGKLVMANARIKWFRPQSYYDSGAWRGTWDLDGGGCLMNQSIHAIDLFLHFAGRAVEVYGYTATAAHERIEVEDCAVATVKFANGVFGVIESATALAPGWPLEVEVSGVRGTARIAAESLVKWDFADADPMDARAAALMRTEGANSGASDPAAISCEGHKKIVAGLVQSVATGRSAVIDGMDAKRPIELICGLYQAVKTGIPTRLP